jgi:hypothetical protein
MANTIIIKNSSTTTAVPIAGNLVEAELALNTTDRKIFTKTTGGSVVEISGVKADEVNSFTAAQRGAITALTDGATITPDFALANNFSVTLAGNRTLANPTNLIAGQSGSIFISARRHRFTHTCLRLILGLHHWRCAYIDHDCCWC